jgi:hypothetical protein
LSSAKPREGGEPKDIWDTRSHYDVCPAEHHSLFQFQSLTFVVQLCIFLLFRFRSIHLSHFMAFPLLSWCDFHFKPRSSTFKWRRRGKFSLFSFISWQMLGLIHLTLIGLEREFLLVKWELKVFSIGTIADKRTSVRNHSLIRFNWMMPKFDHGKWMERLMYFQESTYRIHVKKENIFRGIFVKSSSGRCVERWLPNQMHARSLALGQSAWAW